MTSPPRAPPPYIPDPTLSDFFVSPDQKKILRGKYFANVEEVKQKTAETLKNIKIDKFKNCSESGKYVSISVLHQIESTLKVTEV